MKREGDASARQTIRGVMSDPIAAIATALSPAALGIVRTSGEGTVELVAGIFSRPKALAAAPSHTLVHGWILQPETREPIDEVVAAVYRAPSGFTGEDAVELICHGGPAVVTAVYAALLKAGFRAAEGGEFTMRAFAAGKTDLTRAEAISEIISAKTQRAREKASARLGGSVARAFAEIRSQILDAAAALSVEIEYPEDEETVKGSFRPALIEGALESLGKLCATWSAEKLYQSGAEIVLAGATNAGKSKLFNILLKEERAIVSDIHGTTRDWIEAEADFAGIPVRLFDTAGLRETEDKIEAEGISRTRSLLRRADIIFYIVDASAGFTEKDADFFRAAQTANTSSPAKQSRPENAPEEIAPEKNARTEDTPDPSKAQRPVFLVWNKTDRADALPVQTFAAQAASFGLEFQTDRASRTDSAIQNQEEIARATESGAERGSAGGTGRASCPPCGTLRIAGVFPVSAKTGAGIDRLVQAASETLLARTDAVSASAALGSLRQREAALAVEGFLRTALQNAESGFPLDTVIQDLEDALFAVGEITGDTVSADVLDTVFSKFCVGK